LRWTTIAGVSLGSDLMLDPNDLETTFAPGRNFAKQALEHRTVHLAQLPERVQPSRRRPEAPAALPIAGF